MIKRAVIRDFGAGVWLNLQKMANGQVINTGLGGVYRKVKRQLGRATR